MKFKMTMLVTIMLLAILTIGCASASEDINLNETLSIDNVDEASLDVSDDDSKELSSDNAVDVNDKLELGEGNFENLYEQINTTPFSNVDLFNDFLITEDDWDRHDLYPKNNMTINGHGHSIKAKEYMSCEFIINSTGVTFKNLVFEGMIYFHWYGDYGTISNCTFKDCSLPYDTPFKVEGVKNLKIENCNFINGEGMSGGAIGLTDVDTCNIINCNFIGNTVEDYGGAIYGKSVKNINIEGATFTNNAATHWNGGSIGFYETDYITISKCKFKNCTAPWDGGAITIEGNHTTITDCNFTDNTGLRGGAAYVRGKYESVSNCIFKNDFNKSNNDIYIWGDYSTVRNCEFSIDEIEAYPYNIPLSVDGDNNEISYCIFTNNSYTAMGISGTNVTATRCEFINNHGEQYSALCVGSSNNITISDCLFVNNTAKEYSSVVYLGSPFYYPWDNPIDCRFYNCTFVNNSGCENLMSANEFMDNYRSTIYSSKFINNEGGVDRIITIGCTFEGNTNTSTTGYAENCIFINNDAGIKYYIYGGSAVNCTFSENKGSCMYGCATDCRFINNSGKNTPLQGSAVNSIFINNSASEGTGALGGGSAENCTFINNTGRYNGALGGTATNCRFINNTATANYGAMSGTATNCTFINNKASGDGGAMSGTATNCTFINNKATNGGAISSGTAINCTFKSNSAVNGGVIYYSAKTINCSFENNSADSCGGVIYANDGKSTISNCSFKNNKAGSDGGAIYFIGDKGTITGCIFVKNTANGDGGAVFWDKSYTGVDITQCSFEDNSGINGGAAYVDLQKGLVSDCNFTNNKASGDGGAMYSTSRTGTASNCNFQNNTAQNYGGALYWNGFPGTVSDCRFVKNSANEGGAVYWKSAAGVIDNSIFENNTATDKGGAICWNSYTGTISNSVFENNTAKQKANIYSYVDDLELINNTFKNGDSGNATPIDDENNTQGNGTSEDDEILLWLDSQNDLSTNPADLPNIFANVNVAKGTKGNVTFTCYGRELYNLALIDFDDGRIDHENNIYHIALEVYGEFIFEGLNSGDIVKFAFLDENGIEVKHMNYKIHFRENTVRFEEFNEDFDFKGIYIALDSPINATSPYDEQVVYGAIISGNWDLKNATLTITSGDYLLSKDLSQNFDFVKDEMGGTHYGITYGNVDFFNAINDGAKITFRFTYNGSIIDEVNATIIRSENGINLVMATEEEENNTNQINADIWNSDEAKIYTDSHNEIAYVDVFRGIEGEIIVVVDDRQFSWNIEFENDEDESTHHGWTLDDLNITQEGNYSIAIIYNGETIKETMVTVSEFGNDEFRAIIDNEGIRIFCPSNATVAKITIEQDNDGNMETVKEEYRQITSDQIGTWIVWSDEDLNILRYTPYNIKVDILNENELLYSYDEWWEFGNEEYLPLIWYDGENEIIADSLEYWDTYGFKVYHTETENAQVEIYIGPDEFWGEPAYTLDLSGKPSGYYFISLKTLGIDKTGHYCIHADYLFGDDGNDFENEITIYEPQSTIDANNSLRIDIIPKKTLIPSNGTVIILSKGFADNQVYVNVEGQDNLTFNIGDLDVDEDGNYLIRANQLAINKAGTYKVTVSHNGTELSGNINLISNVIIDVSFYNLRSDELYIGYGLDGDCIIIQPRDYEYPAEDLEGNVSIYFDGQLSKTFSIKTLKAMEEDGRIIGYAIPISKLDVPVGKHTITVLYEGNEAAVEQTNNFTATTFTAEKLLEYGSITIQDCTDTKPVIKISFDMNPMSGDPAIWGRFIISVNGKEINKKVLVVYDNEGEVYGTYDISDAKAVELKDKIDQNKLENWDYDEFDWLNLAYLHWHVNDFNANILTSDLNINTPGKYEISIKYTGSDNADKLDIMDKTITYKATTTFTASKLTTTYGTAKKMVFTLKDAKGKSIASKKVTVVFNNKKYTKTTNSKGQITLEVSKSLAPKKYSAKFTFAGDGKYAKSTRTFTVVVNKATPKLTAGAKTFKTSDKTKKYTITLKTDKKAVMKYKKVTVKVNKKTYTAKTNKKGQATFQLTKLTKKGKFTATVKFAGNSKYKAVTKKVKMTVK